MMEIIITGIIVVFAIFILVRSAKKKASGQCDCGSCSSHCPMYKEKQDDKSKR